MRGALVGLKVGEQDGGIIPARAGSTGSEGNALAHRWDHPRSCGEHPDESAPKPNQEGSSPLVRGALEHRELDDDDVGIIPARAGSTAWQSAMTKTFRDHPRSCGEHEPKVTQPLAPTGSSPLVRGARKSVLLYERGEGIIPARAGSTYSGSAPNVAMRDHPRSCGEHSMCSCLSMAGSGSSPLVRGALTNSRLVIVFIGIIPARAGSTMCPRACRRCSRDHPRSCGEH